MFGYYRPHHYLIAAAIGFAIGYAVCAHEAHAGTLDLDLNLASIHTEAWARSGPDRLSQSNPGLGVTYHFNRTWALMGGEYRNSYRKPTWYAVAAWTPLHVGAADRWHVDAGLAAGLASGYSKPWQDPYSPAIAAAVVRIVAPSGVSLDLLAVPNDGPRSSGFVGLQVGFPLR